MSMPSAFELGGAIGSNVAGGIRGAQENTALDQILQQAIQSNDPQVQQDVMRQILTRVSPEKQPAALQVLQNKTQQMQQQRQRQAYAERGLNPDLPESINKEIIKSSGQSQEAQKNMQGSINAINELEKLVTAKGIGLVGHINKSEEARFNRGNFQSLQAKLLPLFKSMFPRGMTEKEFKFIQENYIPQVNDTEATIKGKLKGLRQLVGDEASIDQESQATQQNQFVKMRDPSGVIRNIPANQAQAAQAAGGTIVQ